MKSGLPQVNYAPTGQLRSYGMVVMQTIDELKYSQSVWGFQPRKAEIRKVCEVKGLLRNRNHLDVSKDRFRQRCQIVPPRHSGHKGAALSRQCVRDTRWRETVSWRIRSSHFPESGAKTGSRKLLAFFPDPVGRFDIRALLVHRPTFPQITEVPHFHVHAAAVLPHTRARLGKFRLHRLSESAILLLVWRKCRRMVRVTAYQASDETSYFLDGAW